LTGEADRDDEFICAWRTDLSDVNTLGNIGGFPNVVIWIAFILFPINQLLSSRSPLIQETGFHGAKPVGLSSVARVV
jgi:hypothetical protein